MIFRKPNISQHGCTSPLQRIHARIDNQDPLRLAILNASEDEGVLVILCTEVSMVKIIKLSLQNHWPGEIEVYNPASLMTGSKTSDRAAEQLYQSADKSLRYLN